MVSLVNERTGTVCLPCLRIRSDFFGRFAGYLAIRRPPLSLEGMLLIGTARVHTLFMGFPLDLFFLDASLRVLGVEPFVPPFRFPSSPPGCRHVLEVPHREGTSRLDLLPGDRLVLSLRVRP
jgi:uncharacterized membrane protein (UPF0127 family)